MNQVQAKSIVRRFFKEGEPQDDVPAFEEASRFLVDNGDMDMAQDLGGYYYGIKQYDLALKYYTLAAENGKVYSWLGLGYIWYYGRTGVRDYARSFQCFANAVKALTGDDVNDAAFWRNAGRAVLDTASHYDDYINAMYKIADMYRAGHYVERDYSRYAFLIRRLYDMITADDGRDIPDFSLPELELRLAEIVIREDELKRQGADFDFDPEQLKDGSAAGVFAVEASEGKPSAQVAGVAESSATTAAGAGGAQGAEKTGAAEKAEKTGSGEDGRREAQAGEQTGERDRRPDAPMDGAGKDVRGAIPFGLKKTTAGDEAKRRALELLDDARWRMDERLHYSQFFGNFSNMKSIVLKIYDLKSFDPDDMDLYDLYYVLRKPCTVTFNHLGTVHTVTAQPDGGWMAVDFDGSWYRSVGDFMKKARIDGERTPLASDDCYDFQVIPAEHDNREGEES